MGALDGLYGGPEVTTRPYDGYTRPGVRRHPLDILMMEKEDKENW